MADSIAPRRSAGVRVGRGAVRAACMLLGACSLAAPSTAQLQQDSRIPCPITGRFDPTRPQALGRDIAAQVAGFVCGAGNATTSSTTASKAAAEAGRLAEDISVAVAVEATPPDGCASRSTLRIDGLSIPSNEVRAIAAAFNESLVLGDAAACRPCAAAAALLAHEFEGIYVEAVAAAEAQLLPNFGALIVPHEVFVEVIVNATAAEFATVLAQTRAALNGTCAAACPAVAGSPATVAPGRAAAVVTAVISEACAVPVEDVLAAINATKATGSEAAKEVLASQADAGKASASIDAASEAMAGWMAAAIAELSGGCAAVACVLSKDDISAAAAEVATAFSAAFAAARGVCAPALCDATEEALTATLAAPLTAGAVAAVERQCPGQRQELNETQLRTAISGATASSTAAIIAQVTAAEPATVCDLSQPAAPPAPAPAPIPAPARADEEEQPACSGTCVTSGRPCFGTSTRFKDSPAACCDPDQVCVRRNARFSQCRRADAAVPANWDGRVEACRKPAR